LVANPIEPGLIQAPPDAPSAEGRRLPVGFRDRCIEARCRLGDPVGVQHGGGRCRRRGSLVRVGARLLLPPGPGASSFAFYSDATVKLIGSSVAETTRDPTVGRAEALRRAMLAMIDKGAAHEAHPAYWAPFVVVDEGAAAH